MTRRRIAVIAGGLSLEREVSLRSGRRIADALRVLGHEVMRMDVDADLVDRLREEAPELAYLALHGRAGEDGTVQGLLELLGLPYTGPDPVASSLAWDKAIMKGELVRAGLATPAWITVSADAVRDMGAGRLLPRVVDRLGLPLVVKPTQGGASMGVRHVEALDDLAGALVDAYRYHPVALIERHVAGTEVAVSIVGDEALPPVEIVPHSAHYDFAARYTHGATEFHAPARLHADVLHRCREDAHTAFRLAHCRHVTRIDMIVDAEGVPWLLELDTCPGMTETSLLPLAADAAGWSFEDLCGRIVEVALEAPAPV